MFKVHPAPPVPVCLCGSADTEGFTLCWPCQGETPLGLLDSLTLRLSLSLWSVLWLTHHSEFSFGLRIDTARCCVPFPFLQSCTFIQFQLGFRYKWSSSEPLCLSQWILTRPGKPKRYTVHLGQLDFPPTPFYIITSTIITYAMISSWHMYTVQNHLINRKIIKYEQVNFQSFSANFGKLFNRLLKKKIKGPGL